MIRVFSSSITSCIPSGIASTISIPDTCSLANFAISSATLLASLLLQCTSQWLKRLIKCLGSLRTGSANQEHPKLSLAIQPTTALEYYSTTISGHPWEAASCNHPIPPKKQQLLPTAPLNYNVCLPNTAKNSPYPSRATTLMPPTTMPALQAASRLIFIIPSPGDLHAGNTWWLEVT